MHTSLCWFIEFQPSIHSGLNYEMKLKSEWLFLIINSMILKYQVFQLTLVEWWIPK